MDLTNKSKYIVYIDESNILAKNGHCVYVAVCVRFLHKDDITKKIKNIEEDLKISYVHWADMPWKLRVKFAEKIKSTDFFCQISIYKNPIKQNNILEDFLVKIIELNDNIFKMTIDGNKGKKYVNKLKKVLKCKGLKFYKINFADDKREPLVRLADFMAGMYRSFLDNKNSENIYIYSLLKHKIKIPD
ncbi:DUF3800 domain-containing protein [Arenimonas sp.]|nr:DUF3800 domain-containing protein [Candidatus Parcubacteria bacterium]